MKRKAKNFHGGFDFSRLKGEPEKRIVSAAVSGDVTIPLLQGFGEPVSATVEIGSSVVAGQIVGRDDDTLSFPVHAPISGRVSNFVDMDKGDGESIPALLITPDEKALEEPVAGANSAIDTLSAEQVQTLLYLSGVGSLFSAGFPSPYNSSEFERDQVSSILINAVNSEPYLPSPAFLLADRIPAFVEGLKALNQALPKAHIHVGYLKRDQRLFETIRAEAGAPQWLTIHPLSRKYPQEHPTILVQSILGQKVQAGASAASVGALVADVQAVLHARDAVVEGKPVIERIVALGGTALKETLYVKTRIGLSIGRVVESHLIFGVSPRVIHGGLMTGKTVVELSEPVTRTTAAIAALPTKTEPELVGSFAPGADRGSVTNAFLSAVLPFTHLRAEADIGGELRPCVQCNYCEEVCPVEIIPHLVSKYVTHDMVDETERLRILACIDCGLCSYVCPSKIDLLADIQHGKATLIEEKLKYEETA